MMAIHLTNTNSFEAAKEATPDLETVVNFGVGRTILYCIDLMAQAMKTGDSESRSLAYNWLRKTSLIFCTDELLTIDSVYDYRYDSPTAFASTVSTEPMYRHMAPRVNFDLETYISNPNNDPDDLYVDQGEIVDTFPDMLFSEKEEERRIAYSEIMALAVLEDNDSINLLDAGFIEAYGNYYQQEENAH